MKTKQVIVMRVEYPGPDGKPRGLRKGKLIAQACHASMAFMTRRLQLLGPRHFSLSITEEMDTWLGSDFTKICLQVNTEAELLDLYDKAVAAGVEAHIVTDSGKTEFDGVPTKTCIALGPNLVEQIDAITGHLKML